MRRSTTSRPVKATPPTRAKATPAKASPAKRTPAKAAPAPAPQAKATPGRPSPRVLLFGGGKSQRMRSAMSEGVLSDLRKMAKARRASYRAAFNPRNRGVGVLGGSGDSHADQLTRRMLRELARDLDRNASIFTTLHNRAAQFLTGRGVRWIPRTSSTAWNKAAEQWLDERMRTTDVDVRGLSTGYALLVDGDVATLLCEQGQMQICEADQLDGSLYANGKATTELSTGIQLDNANGGRVEAFHLRPYGEYGTLGQATPYAPQFVTFAALRERPSQTRGTPALHAALDDFERADSYMESETIAAEISSQIWMILKHRDGQNPYSPGGSPNNAEQNDSVIRGGQKADGTIDWQGITSGSVFGVPDGMDASAFNPQRPNVNAEPFLIWLLRCWCAGAGFPYELIFGDLRQMSWAVAKALIDLANARIADLQEKILDQCFRRQALHQIDWAIEQGLLPEAPADWQRGDLDWPRLTEPDDEKRFSANDKGIRTGQTSRQRALGHRAWKILDELGEEYAYAADIARRLNQRFPEFTVTPQEFLGGQPAGTVAVPPSTTTDEPKPGATDPGADAYTGRVPPNSDPQAAPAGSVP